MRVNPMGPEGGRLYAAIIEAGFSIGGFARRMGVVRSTVWRIDRGVQSPPEDWWHRAAALLGVRIEDITPHKETVAA